MINEDELNKFFELLKNTLPLGNWNAELKIVDKDIIEEFTSGNNSYACIDYKPNIMFATIYLNKDVNYVNGDNEKNSIAHELIHLLMYDLFRYLKTNSDLKDNEFYEYLCERTIELIARGIVKCIDH